MHALPLYEVYARTSLAHTTDEVVLLFGQYTGVSRPPLLTSAGAHRNFR